MALSLLWTCQEEEELLMAFLLIKMVARQECQLRYQLEKMTNACPHCYGTRTKMSVWGECNCSDGLSAPETGNK